MSDAVTGAGQLFATWSQVVSSIVVAILAVWGEQIRRWFVKVKLCYEIHPRDEYMEMFGEDADNSSCSLCLKVSNVGKCIARDCSVQCSAVYHKIDQSLDRFVLFNRPFVAKDLLWKSGRLSESIRFNQPAYCRLFLLMPESKSMTGVSSEGEGNADEGHEGESGCLSLYLRINMRDDTEGESYYQLKNEFGNTFLVPLDVSCENMEKRERVWVEIHWKEGDKKWSMGNLSVEKVDVQECGEYIKVIAREER